MKLASVIFGAALGASARYLLGGWITASTRGSFPWGTLAVNLIGCLVIGVAWGFGERAQWAPTTRAFLFVGILGSFTTFSSFGLETMSLVRGDGIGQALGYILMSNVGGIALVWIGMMAGRATATG